MPRLHFPHVPGLFLFADYFAPDECHALVEHSLALYERLEAAVGYADAPERAHIPQPAYVRSAEHNLQTEEHFAYLALADGDHTIRAEYFPRYGENGHALAYFQRNANLPDFVARDVVPRVHGLVAGEGLVSPDDDLVWKLTMNFYRRAGGRVAGFPFHVDIPSNGAVTMILNVQREALFQIAKGDAGGATDIELPVGALLLLSGESRWEWKHRVLPSEAPAGENGHPVGRVSLVLGYGPVKLGPASMLATVSPRPV